MLKYNENKFNKLKQQVKKFDVISFDIFDTLLCRPYMHPTDLFKHLEKMEGATGFAKERIKAENRARQKFKNYTEINYDEIYDEIAPKFKNLKEKELELEAQTLYVNPDIKKIYDYALSLGKKIIIISDMYLKPDYLEKVLKSKGYINFEKLYVSSESRKNKHSCELFNYAINDLSLKASQILHFGDHYHSDVNMAKICGISAFHCEKPSDYFLSKKENRWLKDLYESNRDSLTISIILAMLVRKSLTLTKISFWQKIGYYLGGPACYGLTKFMLDEINKENIKEAVFVARDGYVLQKIFNIFQKGDIKTHYVYAPRLINLTTSLKYKKVAWWTYQPISIVNYYLQESKELAKRKKRKLKTYEDYVGFIKKNVDILEPLRKIEEQNYKNYLSQFNFKEKSLALLDISAGSFNSLKLLSRMLPDKNFYALYWLIAGYADTKDWHCKDFQNSRINNKWQQDVKTLKNYNFLEFLITSPELPIKTIKNNKPIYISNKPEKIRAKIYISVAEFELEFAQDIKTIFNDFDVVFAHDDLILLLNKYLASFTLIDSLYFLPILHGNSEDHKVYVPLIDINIRPFVTFNPKYTFDKIMKIINLFRYYSYN